METYSHVILFDGECNLCNWWVKLVLRNDKKGVFRFSPLQGETAKKLLIGYPNNEIGDSVLFICNGSLYQQSTAALQIARNLRFYRLLFVFIIIPRPIRDIIYRWVARNRYKWFGKQDTCMVPDEKWKERFV